MNPYMQMLLMALQGNDPMGSAFTGWPPNQGMRGPWNTWPKPVFPFGFGFNQVQPEPVPAFTPMRDITSIPAPTNTPEPIMSDPFRLTPTNDAPTNIPANTPVGMPTRERQPSVPQRDITGMTPGFIGTQFGQMPIFGFGIPGIDPNVMPKRNVPNAAGMFIPRR